MAAGGGCGEDWRRIYGKGRKSAESGWRRKFFLVSSVRAGLGSRKKKRNGSAGRSVKEEEEEEVSAREVTRN